MLVTYVDHGQSRPEYQGGQAVLDAREHRAKALEEMPINALSLMKGEPVLPTIVRSI